VIYTHLAALLLGAAVAGAGAWKVQGWRFDAVEKERFEAQAEARRIDAKVIDTAAVGHEADKREIRTEFITITEKVERIVREPFYAADGPACLDIGGLRELADAIAPRAAASEPARAVPGPGAAR
jgi:hypothetical protein